MLRHPRHPELCPFHAEAELQLLESHRLGAEIATTLYRAFHHERRRGHSSVKSSPPWPRTASPRKKPPPCVPRPGQALERIARSRPGNRPRLLRRYLDEAGEPQRLPGRLSRPQPITMTSDTEATPPQGQPPATPPPPARSGQASASPSANAAAVSARSRERAIPAYGSQQAPPPGITMPPSARLPYRFTPGLLPG